MRVSDSGRLCRLSPQMDVFIAFLYLRRYTDAQKVRREASRV
jgi:hypothetical protein